MGFKKDGTNINIKELQTLIHDGSYKEAWQDLTVKTVKSISARESAGMVMDLLPVRTRPAKEMVSLLMEYAYPSLEAVDGEEDTLLGRAVRYERMDVLLLVIRNLDSRKMKQAGKDWTEVVCYLLDRQQKVSLEHLLKKNVLKYLDDEKREEIYRGILGFKDMEMLRYVVQYEREFPIQLLELPQNNAERNFLKNALNRYAGKIKLHHDTDRLWEMGLSCDADRFLRILLKKKKFYQYLGKLAQGSDPLFGLVAELSPGKILDEVKEEVLLQAFLSDAGMERYELLCKKGWNKSSTRKEKIRIKARAQEYLSHKHYEKNKRGSQENLRDQKKWKALAKLEAND